jgi:hypothetical protein
MTIARRGERVTCPGCRQVRTVKSRGLCTACYADPAVRVRFSPGSCNPWVPRLVLAPDTSPPGPTDAELDAQMRAVLDQGKPAWWHAESRRSVIFELHAAGRLFPWRREGKP